MRKFLAALSFLLLFSLLACSKSLEDYEELLEEKGWDVTIMDPEEYSDDEDAPDGIVKVLVAEKDLWEYGFIYEFNSARNARDFYNELKGEDEAEDIDDYVKRDGNYVFINLSDSFFEDLDID